MVKVLLVDDGTPSRMMKTGMYMKLAQSRNPDVEVTRITLQELDSPQKLTGYDVILTDLDGDKTGPGTQNDTFLTVLDQAVKAGARPIVKMFSGYFTNPDQVDSARFEALKLNNIVSTHMDMESAREIASAITETRVREKTRAATVQIAPPAEVHDAEPPRMLETGFTPVIPFPVDETVVPASTTPAARKDTVLVVDDEKQLRDLTKFELENRGIPYLEAASRAEAMAVYEANKDRIHSVLTDCRMGDEPTAGIEVIRHIRAQDASLPITMLTGEPDEVTKTLAGLNTALLKKPCTTIEIVNAINTMLGRPQETAPELSAAPPASETNAKAAAKGNAVLVVEPNETQRDAIKMYLDFNDINNVMMAASRDEALATFMVHRNSITGMIISGTAPDTADLVESLRSAKATLPIVLRTPNASGVRLDDNTIHVVNNNAPSSAEEAVKQLLTAMQSAKAPAKLESALPPQTPALPASDSTLWTTRPEVRNEPRITDGGMGGLGG